MTNMTAVSSYQSYCNCLFLHEVSDQYMKQEGKLSTSTAPNSAVLLPNLSVSVLVVVV